MFRAIADFMAPQLHRRPLEFEEFFVNPKVESIVDGGIHTVTCWFSGATSRTHMSQLEPLEKTEQSGRSEEHGQESRNHSRTS